VLHAAHEAARVGHLAVEIRAREVEARMLWGLMTNKAQRKEQSQQQKINRRKWE
jgi:hypothetical protein